MKILIKNKLIVAAIAAFFVVGGNCLAVNPLDVTIIEIGASEASGYEYIKIFNNTDKTIDLEGWKFVEGFSDSKPSGIRHSLKEFNSGFSLASNNTAVICQDPIKFSGKNIFNGLILDSSWGSLNESGERLQLLDAEGNVIENFTYIEAKESTLKRMDFTLPDYTSANWLEESLEKILPDPSRHSGTSEASQEGIKRDNKDEELPKIIFTEILPNPIGADNEKEFIEIKNIGDRTISLNGWQLQDNSERVFTLNTKNYNDSLLRPNYFFVFYRDETRIALNNSSGDELKLYDNQGTLINKISYTKKAEENLSYAKDENNVWRWTKNQSPGEENNLEPLNHNPVIELETADEVKIDEEITFDASDSYDPDGDEIFFNWNFGDGNSSTLINPDHSYAKAGKYKLRLSIFDTRNASSTKEFLINVSSQKISNSASRDYPRILISEIFPNPAGRDDGEFIELFNPNPFEVDLSEWILKDESKSGKWKIENNIIIEPREYLVFTKEETKINLNNNSDSVYLMSPDEKIIDKISYDKAQEEMSYNLTSEGEWAWSHMITPWEENGVKDFSSLDLFSSSDFENQIRQISEDEIKNCEVGELVQVSGTVTAEPGLLGKQIFYINGAQVYMYSKDFPELNLGDKIIVAGELTTANEELRLKIKEKNDITKLEKSEEPKIVETFIEDINENLTGNLIKISGEITEQKSNTLWLDDNTEEIKIYLNKYTGINLDKLPPGQTAEITGILSRTESGFRLLPRYNNDIKIGEVMGEKVYAAEDELENNLFENNPLNKYLFAAILATIIISVNIIWKNKQKEKNNN